MKAYNTNLGLLLPGLRVDWAGLNLEDFMRRVLLAAKSARQDNLYYAPYPIVRNLEGVDAAVTHSEEIICLAENQLARYVILPQEVAMVRVYRAIMRDAGLDSYPAKLEKKDFYGHYLAGLGFPALEQAFDALFWFLVGRTSRTLNAVEGIKLTYAFFQDPATQLVQDRTEIVPQQFKELTPKDLEFVEHNIELGACPFSVGSKFILVGSDQAPLEGLNTVFVEFAGAPRRAKLSCRMHTHDIERMGDPKAAYAQLARAMLLLAEVRLGKIFVSAKAGENNAA